MPLAKYEPNREMEQVRTFRNEIDRVFEDFFRPLSAWGREGMVQAPFSWGLMPEAKGFAPSVDLKETDDAYIFTAELPGMKKEDIDINLTEGSLRLRGERREEKEEKSGSYFMHECVTGSFSRVVPLPGPVNLDKVEAKMKDGILTVTMSKADKPKKLEIKVSD